MRESWLDWVQLKALEFEPVYSVASPTLFYGGEPYICANCRSVWTPVARCLHKPTGFVGNCELESKEAAMLRHANNHLKKRFNNVA